MATIQIRVDDEMKAAADFLFNNFGLDTSSAIRIFLSTSLANWLLPIKTNHLY